MRTLNEDIDDIRGNLSSALSVLQLKDTQRVQDDIAQVKVLLDLVRAGQMSSDLRDWLKAPDATIDHNAACAKKTPWYGDVTCQESSVFEMVDQGELHYVAKWICGVWQVSLVLNGDTIRSAAPKI